MIEAILVGLLLKIGGRAIDRYFLPETRSDTRRVVGIEGNVGYSSVHEGRTVIGADITTSQHAGCETIIGNIFSVFDVDDVIATRAISLVVILEEITQEPWLFEIDPTGGFEVCLPPGIYSFYVFLLDGNASSFLDAEIFGVAQPSKIHLSGVDEIDVDPPEAMYDLLDDAPIQIRGFGRFRLDMILVDTSGLPGFPRFFSELLGIPATAEWTANDRDLTGLWHLEERYAFGSSIGSMSLIQAGDTLSGVAMSEHVLTDGSRLVVQQAVAGTVDGTNVSISGIKIRSLTGTGSGRGYLLDQWLGTIYDDEIITGEARDEEGARGPFLMQRAAYVPGYQTALPSSVAERARRHRQKIAERKRRRNR